jgi:hypothetical protein
MSVEYGHVLCAAAQTERKAYGSVPNAPTHDSHTM